MYCQPHFILRHTQLNVDLKGDFTRLGAASLVICLTSLRSALGQQTLHELRLFQWSIAIPFLSSASQSAKPEGLVWLSFVDTICPQMTAS